MRRLGVLILVCGTVAAAIGPASARVATNTAGAKLPLMAGRVQVASPGTQLWVARYSGPQYGADASAVAVSPDGSTLYVTGASLGSGSGGDYATVAYDAVSGSQLWAARYNGPANANDSASAVGVSPDGSKVFVTGSSYGGPGQDYATVAYDAASGSQLWVAGYNGPGNSVDQAYALGVSPDGSKVFVTGWSVGAAKSAEYATVAYDAGSGGQLWATRYTGPGGQADIANAIGVSPDGSKVFVTGGSLGAGTDTDYATVAYDTASGSQLWVARYNGPGNSYDAAYALGISPDGSKVFVTGGSAGLGTGGDDYATVAYDAATGGQLWVVRYNGPASSDDRANALGVSPDGSKVFVTGQSARTTGDDYATVAYNAGNGHQLWKARYRRGDDNAVALAVSPDGSTAYVTGSSVTSGGGNSAYATLGYDTVSGSKLWVTLYGPAKSYSQAAALALSPDGSTLYVTGSSAGDYATIAYAAR